MNQQLYYRSMYRQLDYKFSFESRGDGSWRIYIQSQPGYGARESGFHATHRLRDESDGRLYVCWTNPIKTLEDGKSVAKLWADKTEKYILFGERF